MINKTIKADIGIVVIGRNEGDRLVRCLKSLRVDPGKVVYVDSGSTDGSTERAKQHGITVLPLDMNRPFTAARARNEGFAALMLMKPTTSFVQFLDGDCELVDGWLEAASEFIVSRPDVAVVCGRRRERSGDVSVYNHLCDLEWDTPVGKTTSCGGDSLVRVEAFKAVGGFREELMAGEEPELCQRLSERRWAIWRLGKEMTLHDAAMTRFGQWWRRCVRSGYGYAEVLWLTKRSPMVLYKRELERSLIWGGAIPVVIVISGLIHKAAILGVVLYPIQVVRIAIARGPTTSSSWTYATYMTLAKFAELQGIIQFCWYKLRGKASQAIEYKRIHL